MPLKSDDGEILNRGVIVFEGGKWSQGNTVHDFKRNVAGA